MTTMRVAQLRFAGKGTEAAGKRRLLHDQQHRHFVHGISRSFSGGLLYSTARSLDQVTEAKALRYLVQANLNRSDCLTPNLVSDTGANRRAAAHHTEVGDT